jgi:hypothetical protein
MFRYVAWLALVCLGFAIFIALSALAGENSSINFIADSARSALFQRATVLEVLAAGIGLWFVHREEPGFWPRIGKGLLVAAASCFLVGIPAIAVTLKTFLAACVVQVGPGCGQDATAGFYNFLGMALAFLATEAVANSMRLVLIYAWLLTAAAILGHFSRRKAI